MRYRKAIITTVAVVTFTCLGSPTKAQISFPDDFEDGVIDSTLWVWGGLNRATSGGQGGSWQWSHEETVASDGYLSMRVWGPTSGNTFGSEAWVRTLYDYNDGAYHTINFTWEAAVQDSHYNQYYIQVTDGYISPNGTSHWPFGEAPITGTTDLLWRADPVEHPGASYPSGLAKGTRSITIDPAAGVARLYDSPNASGTLLREEPLYPGYPWYVRFMVVDATSAGFPAGDIRLNLYDFASFSSPDCNTNSIPDDCEADSDADGVIDDCDNCLNDPNPDQLNFDGDVDGDACDDDIDNDLVLNVDDVCDYSPPGTPIIDDPAHPAYATHRGTVRGDLDGDCDCDLADHAIFANDLTIPN